MLEIIRNLFKKEITFKVEYKRIKKPAKDELLIFSIKDADVEMVKKFAEMLKPNRNQSGFLVINDGVEIYKTKRKNLKIKC